MKQIRPAKLIAPLVLLCLLVWLMVGCVYIPTFEHADLRGAKQDFRKLTGETKPIGVGRITRQQVLALLGPPPFASETGSAYGYVIDTRQGIWVIPLCFDAHAGNEGQTGLKLVFDDHGILKRYQVLEFNHANDIVRFSYYPHDFDGRQVMQRFNGQGIPNGELGPVVPASELLHPVNPAGRAIKEVPMGTGG
jgi:hypothetical protein